MKTPKTNFNNARLSRSETCPELWCLFVNKGGSFHLFIYAPVWNLMSSFKLLRYLRSDNNFSFSCFNLKLIADEVLFI